MIQLAVLALLTLSFPAFADDPQLPNATDLKAAYCMNVYKAQIGLVQETQRLAAQAGPAGQPLRDKVAEVLRGKYSGIRHMLAYLGPRVPYLDPLALLAASRSADADFARQQELATKHQQECEQDADCMYRWKPPETAESQRIKSCNDLSFLPF